MLNTHSWTAAGWWIPGVMTYFAILWKPDGRLTDAELHSVASMTPRSRAGYTSAPGRMTVDAPRLPAISAHAPAVRIFSPWKSSRVSIFFFECRKTSVGKMPQGIDATPN